METFKLNQMLLKLSLEFGFKSGKCTPVNQTSFDTSRHLSISPCELVQITDSCSWWTFMRVYKQSIKQKGLHIWTVTITHINFIILNSHVTVNIFKI